MKLSVRFSGMNLKDGKKCGICAKREIGRAPQSSSGCYLEAKDDGPDQTQGETVIPIHNVMWAHIF